MPLTASAQKRAIQNRARHLRLLPYKTRMKSLIRSLTESVKAGKKQEATSLLPQVFKAIDMAAKKQIIHARNADRKKAAMAKMVAK